MNRSTLRPVLPLLFCAMLSLLLTACSHPAGTQYWQRSNPSQAVYMHGAKAQQMLHRDIQNCVSELNELERLHQLEDPIPTTWDGYIKEADPSTLYSINAQGGDAALFSGANDYTNFDGCMYAKGWERIKHLPYSVTDILNKRPKRAKPDSSGLVPKQKQPPTPYNSDRADYGSMNE